MTDKDFFTLQTDHFLIEGRSRSGHETVFRIREAGLALDIGRCPDMVVPMPRVFITHAHLDHAAGIAFYAAQRRLQKLDDGVVYVPSEAEADFRLILETHERLAGAEFPVEIRGLAVGHEVPLGRGRMVRAYAATHRVAARAYELIEHDVPILFYTGDTDRGLLERCDSAYKARVLLIECSFLADGHQDRAAKYRHMHIDDIADFADRFENELIVLTHFSQRYSREQIRDTVRRRLPAGLRERIRLALPHPFQRL